MTTTNSMRAESLQNALDLIIDLTVTFNAETQSQKAHYFDDLSLVVCNELRELRDDIIGYDPKFI